VQKEERPGRRWLLVGHSAQGCTQGAAAAEEEEEEECKEGGREDTQDVSRGRS